MEQSSLKDFFEKRRMNRNESVNEKKPEPLRLNKKRGGCLNLMRFYGASLPAIAFTKDSQWKIQVTHVEDFNTIRISLIGEDYEEEYKTLSTEMEAYYKSQKNLAAIPHVKIGGVYAALNRKSYHRIKILRTKGDGLVSGFFVDQGDERQLSIGNIYDLHENFTILPPKNIACALSGFESLDSQKDIFNLLTSLVISKSLVMKVATSRDKISLVLFDEDVNINNFLFMKLWDRIKKQTFPKIGGVTEVHILHINLDGDVYIQFPTEVLPLLEEILEKARLDLVMEQCECTQVNTSHIYLAKFSEDQQWYRASPVTDMIKDGQALMKFIDFGNVEVVPIRNIREIESPHVILAAIPGQAHSCCLHGLPPAGKEMTECMSKLREMLSLEKTYLLKVIEVAESDERPLVEIFINGPMAAENESVNLMVIREMTVRNSPSGKYQDSDSSTTTESKSSSEPADSSDISTYAPNQNDVMSIPVEVPNSGIFFDVHVVSAASPSDFTIHSLGMRCKLLSMMLNMQTYYNNASNFKTIHKCKAEAFCAVKIQDGQWCRGQVTTVENNAISGVLIDHGDYFTIPAQCVQPLHPDFSKLPCLAMKARLYGVVPKGPAWTADDCSHFQKLVVDRDFVSIVLDFETRGNNRTILMKLIDSRDVFIDEYLVEKGIAAKESFC